MALETDSLGLFVKVQECVYVSRVTFEQRWVIDAHSRDRPAGEFAGSPQDRQLVDIDKLSVLRRSGKFAGRPVTRVRVYDPSLLKGDTGDINTFLHLDEQAQAVCFEGHTEKGRTMDLNARGCMEETATAA